MTVFGEAVARMLEMPDSVTFDVEGIPGPQGSKRHVGNGRMIESSKKVKPWRVAVASVAKREGVMFDAPVAVTIAFRLYRPQRPKWTRHGTRPDLDKLTRSTMDALTGAIITDDGLAFHLDVSKRYVEAHETTGALINITAW